MRSGSVSMPCRISQAVCGLMRRAEVAQALAPRAQQEGADGALLAEDHVVEAVVGLRSARRNLPERSQSKLPESTTTPPMTVPWPDRNLVAEWYTRSAPQSKGLMR